MENVMLNTNIYGRPFDDLSNKKVLNEALASYKIFLLSSSRFFGITTSDVLFAELSLIKDKSKRDIIFYLIKTVSKERIRLNNKAIEIADLLYPELKDYMDSLHIAFAAISNCTYFVTCDKEITNSAYKIEKLLTAKNFNIKIRSPVRKETVV